MAYVPRRRISGMGFDLTASLPTWATTMPAWASSLPAPLNQSLWGVPLVFMGLAAAAGLIIVPRLLGKR